MFVHALVKKSGSAGRQAGLLTILLTCGLGLASAQASDAVLLDANRYHVNAGRYSAFATFQGNLQRILDICGKGTPQVVAPGEEPRGRIGPETRLGIQRALECQALHEVPRDSAAKTGVITEAVWRAVMPNTPLPTSRERAEALVLSFEATDFGDKPEWNFCEDSKVKPAGEFDPRAPGAKCYNDSDPCSFLTWGPRGATAGQGREIQWILWLAWKRAPTQVENAFAAEFSSVARFFRLKGNPRNRCEHGAPLERFMCAVWLNPARRQVWESALAELGRSPVVRETYAQVYGLDEFDGAKLRAYADLWNGLGLPVSEIDYAFFMDRITHLGGPPAEDEGIDPAKLRACTSGESHAAARRCLGQLQPHTTQPTIRLARDVAFYLDAYPEGALSRKEIRAWAEHVPLSAAHNFALSDTRNVQIDAAPSLASLGPDLPVSSTSNLTKAEWNACPREILFPMSRMPPR